MALFMDARTIDGGVSVADVASAHEAEIFCLVEAGTLPWRRCWQPVSTTRCWLRCSSTEPPQWASSRSGERLGLQGLVLAFVDGTGVEQ
jgi:hypothetical protein